MKYYCLSLAAGCLVGVIYGIINVRSPAPPVIALVGLLGILAGEQSVEIFRQRFLADTPIADPASVSTGEMSDVNNNGQNQHGNVHNTKPDSSPQG